MRNDANIGEFNFTTSFVFLDRNRRIRRDRLYSLLLEILPRDQLIFRPIVRTGIFDAQGESLKLSASLIIAKSTREPAFSKGRLTEEVISYILLIEAKNLAAIQTRNVPIYELEPLFEYFDKINHSNITSVISDSAKIKKITSKIINPAQSGITGRSYEGHALESEMPSYGNGRAIPKGVKALQSGKILSVYSPTSRITNYGKSKPITEIGIWLNIILPEIESDKQSKFIKKFAQPVDFSKEIENITPSGIFFDTLSIKRIIDEDQLTIKREFKGKSAAASEAMIQALFDRMEGFHFIKKVGQKRFSGEYVDAKILKRKISVNLKILADYSISDGKKEIPLSTFLNSKNLFSVYFNDCSYLYSAGTIFHEKSNISEIESIISALVEIPQLATADREKLLVDRNDSTDTSPFTSFPTTSVFGILENYLSNNSAEFIFCDDLSDEWADHISLDKANKVLCFHHSKHGNQTTSASKLHDVIGQALKNIGHVNSSSADMTAKLLSITEIYPNTAISRIRREPNGLTDETRAKSINSTLKDLNLRRAISICCSFVSKNRTASELRKLVDGKKTKAHIHQLFWLLSAYISSAREMNIQPIIYCAP